MYGGVLRLPVAKQAVVVEFADGVGVVVLSNHPDKVQIYANEIFRTIKFWLENFGLELVENSL